MKKDFTKGSIVAPLLKLALPVMLVFFLHMVYQVIDLFWLGQLGAGAIAAVSACIPVTFLIGTLGSGFSIAGSILVAQYYGARKHERVNEVATQTVAISTLVGLGFVLLGLLLAPSILAAMGVGSDVLPDATSYLSIIFFGMVFSFAFMAEQSVLNGVGETRTPLLIVLASVLLNFVLDPIFINGFGPIPAMGVAGAAWVTIGTELLSAVAGFAVLYYGWRGVRVDYSNFSFDWPLLKELTIIGFPGVLDRMTYSLNAVIITSLAAGFGTMALAAFGVAQRVSTFFFLPGMGLSVAAGIMAGRCLGAGKKERAVRVAREGAILSFLALSFFGALLLLFGRGFAGLFLPNDAGLVSIAFLYMAIDSLGFGLGGVRMTLVSIARASGNMLQALGLSLVTIVLRLSVAIAAAGAIGFYGLALSYPLGSFLMVFFCYAWFKKSRWWETSLVPTPEEDLLEEECTGIKER